MSRAPADLARRYFRQLLDLEGETLTLERLGREEALELLRAAGAPEPASEPAGGLTRGGSASPAPSAGRSVRGSAGRSATAAAAATPREIEISEIERAPDLEALSELVAACARCPLHESRTRPVFGEGNPSARVVCVGEAPGAREDETGRPFVGRAGKLLDRLLQAVGLPRESVYICNVLKSRPPRNRDPLPEEVAACTPFLLRQLALIEPDVIVAFGAFAARTLLDTRSSLGGMRGDVHEYAGYPVIVTYHPAALLRNPGWTRPTWEDLQLLRRLLDDGRETVSGSSGEGEGLFG